MITIGEFARLGRVSVRMLRHYDALGLLSPHRVDPHSGYRYYGLEQLARLNRIVVLKDLGLRLEQVGQIVDERVDAGQLRAMLRLREAELEAQVAESTHRLARVQARLRLIESEQTMSTSSTITAKSAPAVTTYGLREIADSATQADVEPVITAMYPKIIDALGRAGVTPVGPSIAFYRPAPERSEDALWVHATCPLPADTVGTVEGLERVEIPLGDVASLIHEGSMDGIDAVYQALHRWIRDTGATATGLAREIYLETPDDPQRWVTEVQVDLERA